VVANIINNKVGVEDIPGLDDEEESEVLEKTYPKDTTTNLEKEHEAIESTTPRSQMGSNDVNNTPT
jgi:hypothetical protein